MAWSQEAKQTFSQLVLCIADRNNGLPEVEEDTKSLWTAWFNLGQGRAILTRPALPCCMLEDKSK